MRLLVLTFLLACPNPDPPACELPDEPPSVTRSLEIGDPFDGFRAYTMDRVVERVRGPQGGTHINIGFRVPAEPGDGTDERCMQVSYSSRNAAGETFEREGAFDFELEGDFWVSRSAITDTRMEGTSVGTATLTDALFTATTSVQIFAVFPNEDAGVIDAPPIDLALSSTAFVDMDVIPLEHRCLPMGGNASPPLAWSTAPLGTQSFAVTMVDGDGFVGWMLYDLPASTTSLEAGVPIGYEVLDGAHQADVARREELHGYLAPCIGGERYTFSVHALDVLALPVDRDTDGFDVNQSLARYTIATSSITVVMP